MSGPPPSTRQSSSRVRAYIGLGGNVGDVEATLERALDAIDELPGVRLRSVSPRYRTKPVGKVDQPDFLNAVASVDVTFVGAPATAALGLLAELKRIERELGRQTRERWGPREIDVDLLVFGRHRIELPQLKVPHPRARDRLFVLAPLADLVPRLRPPGWAESVAGARDRLVETGGNQGVQRIGGEGRH